MSSQTLCVVTGKGLPLHLRDYFIEETLDQPFLRWTPMHKLKIEEADMAGDLLELRLRIRRAQMPISLLARFAHELDQLAQIDGRGFDPDEAALILRVTGEVQDTEMAPFDALWKHTELFLSACLFVAVADGQYTVEQSRHISHLADRLSYSVERLSILEGEVLGGLERRGRARLA